MHDNPRYGQQGDVHIPAIAGKSSAVNHAVHGKGIGIRRGAVDTSAPVFRAGRRAVFNACGRRFDVYHIGLLHIVYDAAAVKADNARGDLMAYTVNYR